MHHINILHCPSCWMSFEIITSNNIEMLWFQWNSIDFLWFDTLFQKKCVVLTFLKISWKLWWGETHSVQENTFSYTFTIGIWWISINSDTLFFENSVLFLHFQDFGERYDEVKRPKSREPCSRDRWDLNWRDRWDRNPCPEKEKAAVAYYFASFGSTTTSSSVAQC